MRVMAMHEKQLRLDMMGSRSRQLHVMNALVHS